MSVVAEFTQAHRRFKITRSSRFSKVAFGNTEWETLCSFSFARLSTLSTDRCHIESVPFLNALEKHIGAESSQVNHAGIVKTMSIRDLSISYSTPCYIAKLKIMLTTVVLLVGSFSFSR